VFNSLASVYKLLAIFSLEKRIGSSTLGGAARRKPFIRLRFPNKPRIHHAAVVQRVISSMQALFCWPNSSMNYAMSPAPAINQSGDAAEAEYGGC
jgi:hypothetical protein